MTVRSVLWSAVVAAITITPVAADPSQTPGTKLKVDLAALAKPGDTPSKANASRSVPRSANATLNVPAGFVVNIFAENLSSARNVMSRAAPIGVATKCNPGGMSRAPAAGISHGLSKAVSAGIGLS